MTNHTRIFALLAAFAIEVGAGAADVPSGYVAVARAEQVPSDVLYAVACAESGYQLPNGQVRPWPWALNVDGASRFYATRADARRGLADALAQTQNVDIGLGQISWYWHARRFASPWQALDPYSNLRTAARLLRDQFERCECDNWWVAVERYHAPSETSGALERRARYRRNVERCWNTLVH